MLKSRIITALILIPLLLAAIFFLNPTQFRWLSFIIIGWGYWEWAGFCSFSERWMAPAYALAALVLTLVAYQFSVVLLMNFAVAGWLMATIWLIIYQISDERPTLPRPVTALVGVWVLTSFWIALNFLRDIPVYGIPLLIFSLLLVFITDTSAYFVGRAFGQRKLAPAISPGKTWEGVLGGLCASALTGCIGAWYFWPTPKTRLFFVLLCVFVSGISIVGDLFESLFKRYANVKDSSQLLPGHGGLLDRLDSLSAAIPLFVLGLMFMQRL